MRAIRSSRISVRSSSSLAGGASIARPHSTASAPDRRVAGEQQPLGPLSADAVRPQRGRRRAPDARRRVADLGVLGDHEQVRAERHVGAARDAEAVHLADDRLAAVEQAHEAADVAAHHRVVDHRVPRARRDRGWRRSPPDRAASPAARAVRVGALAPADPPSPRRSRRGRSRRRSPCPLPASSITWTAGSRSARSTHATSSRDIARGVIPLPRSGRSSVIRATRPVTS